MTKLNYGILFYVPNIIGYLRLILIFAGLWLYATFKASEECMICFISAAILDLFDGIIARYLEQF